MSIAFGFVAPNCAFVASDGQLMIGNDITDIDFPKVFEITNNTRKFIGAFTGEPLKNNGISIDEKLQQIFSTINSDVFIDNCNQLLNGLNDFLQTNPNYIGVYLLLIGSSTWNTNNLEMRYVEFTRAGLVITLQPTRPDLQAGDLVCFRAIGTFQSAITVNGILEQCSSGVQKVDGALDYFCRHVIKVAILSDPTKCGGDIFVKRIV